MLFAAVAVQQQGTTPSAGISFIGGDSVRVSSGVTDDLVLTLPAVQTNDFAVVWYYSDIPTDPTSTPPTEVGIPSGMFRPTTPAFPITSTSGRDMYTDSFYGFLSAGQPSITLSRVSGDFRARAAAVMVFRGVHQTNPFDAWPTHATYANDTTPTSPSITLVTSDSAVVSFLAYTHEDFTSLTPPSGQTFVTSTAGFVSIVAAAYELGVASGSHSPGDWTAVGDTTARAESHAATFALRPA